MILAPEVILAGIIAKTPAALTDPGQDLLI